jgi:YVTN family beta-propeller protein
VESGKSAISVFDPEKNSVSSVRVGASPAAIAIDEATNRIYVANNGGESVSVIDGESDAVLATVSVGRLPYVIAANAATNKIYVSNTFSDVITIIDGATNSTTKAKVGSADAIVVDAKRDRLYLAHYENANLTELDGAGAIVREVAVGMHPWGMALDDAGGKLYVTRSGNAELAIVDEASAAF